MAAAPLRSARPCWGGILIVIVFDKMFDTFARWPTGEPLCYGLAEPLVSHNPIRIAPKEWAAIARDFGRAQGWRARLRAMLGTP